MELNTYTVTFYHKGKELPGGEAKLTVDIWAYDAKHARELFNKWHKDEYEHYPADWKTAPHKNYHAFRINIKRTN